MKLTMKSCLASIAALIVIGCDDPGDRYVDQSATELSVTLNGVPDPQHDVFALAAEVGNVDHEIAGEWRGTLRYFFAGRLVEYPLALRLEDDAGTIVATTLKTDHDQDVFENISEKRMNL